MKPIRIGIALAMLLATVLAVSAQKQQDVERQLRAAINTELVDRNPKAAIELYKKVADSGIRPLAAQALIHMADCYRQLGDAEAQKIYERIVQDYKDQKDVMAEAQTQLERMGVGVPSVSFAPKTLTRLLPRSFGGSVSGDGRYLLASYSLRLFDVATREERDIAGEPQFNFAQFARNRLSLSYPEFSVLSADGRQVAYTFIQESGGSLSELRTLPINSVSGTQPKVLIRNPDLKFNVPFGWSPDNRSVFALLVRKDDTTEIASISVSDGSLRSLKSLDWRWPNRLSVSPNGRYIVYDAPVARDSTDRDIFMLSVDSGVEVRVVQDPARDSLPVWTPDANAIVFTSDRSGGDGLWMVRIEGGGARGVAERLKADTVGIFPIGFARDGALYYAVGGSTPPGIDTAEIDLNVGTLARTPASIVESSGRTSFGPAYSPDGRSLAYLDSRSPGLRGLDQTAVRQLASVITAVPLTPEAVLGLVNSSAPRITVVVRSLTSGEEREIPTSFLAAGAPSPAWFPDGQSLALIGDESLHRIDLRTGRDLIDHRVTARQAGTAPSVSPDGKRIYYTKGTGNESFLMAYEVDTLREIELFKGPIQPQTNLPVSPDGRLIAFRIMEPQALYVIPSSGGEARKVFTPTGGEGFAPIAWSVDGKNVLMGRRGDGASRQLWWIPLDGSDARRIGTGTFPIFNSIHPDGRQIAIARRSTFIPQETWVDPTILQAAGQDRRVFEVKISSDGTRVTGPATAVTPSIAVLDRQPMWSPDGKSIAFKRGRSTDGVYDLVVRTLATGNERTYTSNVGNLGMAGYYWFNDNKGILAGVASGNASNKTTYRLDLESGAFTLVPGLDQRPHDISHDDKTVYTMMREAGTNQINVAALDLATDRQNRTPVQGFLNRSPDATPPGGMSGIVRLSPDGRTLALASREGSQWHISLVAVDGRSYRDLYASSLLAMPNGSYTRLLAWTKDSRAILFGQYVQGSRTVVQIMRMPVTGGKPQFTGLTLRGITQEDTIDLSPDGSRLLFSASSDGVSVSNAR